MPGGCEMLREVPCNGFSVATLFRGMICEWLWEIMSIESTMGRVAQNTAVQGHKRRFAQSNVLRSVVGGNEQ